MGPKIVIGAMILGILLVVGILIPRENTNEVQTITEMRVPFNPLMANALVEWDYEQGGTYLVPFACGEKNVLEGFEGKSVYVIAADDFHRMMRGD